MYASRFNLGHLFMLHMLCHNYSTHEEFSTIMLVTKIVFVRLNINNGRQI